MLQKPKNLGASNFEILSNSGRRLISKFEGVIGKSTQIDPINPNETDPPFPFQIDPLFPAEIDPLKNG
jgi:hypothetical protein